MPDTIRSAAARVVLAASLLTAAACSDDSDSQSSGALTCAASNPLRDVFFGDLHVHTALSFDAYSFEVRNGPDDAYRFALGEPARLPPLDADGEGTQVLQLDRPLDFAAVTEHAEFLGEVAICLNPGLAGYDSQLCRTFRENGPVGQTRMGVTLISGTPARDTGLCADGARCREAALSVWEEIIASAQRFNDDGPACAFTTFVAYEYTANTGASAQHRNVIFASETVPQAALSARDAREPGQLWEWLDRVCIDGNPQCDALAIPHNSNWSSGRMWYPYSNRDMAPSEQRRLASLRARVEPRAEI